MVHFSFFSFKNTVVRLKKLIGAIFRGEKRREVGENANRFFLSHRLFLTCLFDDRQPLERNEFSERLLLLPAFLPQLLSLSYESLNYHKSTRQTARQILLDLCKLSLKRWRHRLTSEDCSLSTPIFIPLIFIRWRAWCSIWEVASLSPT